MSRLHKNFSITVLILFYMVIGFTCNATNILEGDTSFETGTSWLVAGSMSGGVKWRQDSTTAAQGTASLRMSFPGKTFVHSRLFQIEDGTYTFSFWAKADSDSVLGWIGIWKPWTQSMTAPIELSTTWKRYSCSGDLTAGGAWLCLNVNQPGTIWVDGFQLERGKKLTGYAQRDSVLLGMEAGTGEEDRIFYQGDAIPFKVQAQGVTNKISLAVQDVYGRDVYAMKYAPVGGVVSSAVNLPALDNGLYHCWLSSLENEIKNHLSFAVVDKPNIAELKTRAFLGLNGVGLLRPGVERIGARIVEVVIRWNLMEKNSGKYVWDSIEKIKALHEKGYIIKATFIGIPEWAWDADEKKDMLSKKIQISGGDLLPSPAGVKGWKDFVGKVCDRYGRYIRYFEIGAEDDLIWGRNAYYRNKYSDHVERGFVVGPFATRLAAFYDQGIVVIRKKAPRARVGLVRPSGSDCTGFDYTFSRAVLSQVAEPFDFFPVDPYVNPRYIGSGLPDVQEVDTHLQDDLNRATAMLAGIGKPVPLAISELGYAVAFRDPIDSPFYLQSAKRMVRAILLARANPNIEFMQWYVVQAGTEGDKVQYNLWKGDNPMPLVPAFHAVSQVVEDTVDVREVPLGKNIKSLIYTKENGAVLALWAQGDDRGAIGFSATGAVYTVSSFLGTQISPERQGEFNKFPVTDFPIYIKAASESILMDILSRAKLYFAPLDVRVHIPFIDRAEVYISNQINNDLMVCDELMIGDKITKFSPFPLVKRGHFKRELKLQGNAGVDFIYTASPDNAYEPFAVHVQEQLIPIPHLNNVSNAPLPILSSSLPPVTRFSGKGDISPPDPAISWHGDDDLSSDVYVAWDNRYLHFEFNVRDDHHVNNETSSYIWKSDAVQIAIDVKADAKKTNYPGYNEDDMELGLALTQNGGELYIWRAGKGSQTSSIPFSVLRKEKEKRTCYRFSIAWDRLGTEPEVGKVLGINYVIRDDDDGKGSSYGNHLSAGLFGPKNPALFRRFFLQ